MGLVDGPFASVLVLACVCLAGFMLNTSFRAFNYTPTDPCASVGKTLFVGDSVMREVFVGLCDGKDQCVKEVGKKCFEATCAKATFLRVDTVSALKGRNLTVGNAEQIVVGLGLHDLLYTRNVSLFEKNLREFVASSSMSSLMWLPMRKVQNAKMVSWKRPFLTNEAVSFYNDIALSVLKSEKRVKVLPALPNAKTIDGIHVGGKAVIVGAKHVCQALKRTAVVTKEAAKKSLFDNVVLNMSRLFLFGEIFFLFLLFFFKII
jgi:hypothetical protein